MDTGPLVAFLNRRDSFHPWARDLFARLHPPLLSCEAVLAEACFLLQGTHGGTAAVLELVNRGILVPQFSLADHLPSVASLMKKYADLPMSLADACLVRMTEIHDICEVASLDSDFLVYRRNGRQRIPVNMPPGIG